MNFEGWNEQAVREEVIAPLLREMGYRSNSKNNIRHEFCLRYPRLYIGRKNEKKDTFIRGKADYLLQVGEAIRWVIEAKPPTVFTLDDVEQAFSYANHPEVRAIYFLLCNGRQFDVYVTNHGPEAGPIYSITYEQLQDPIHKETLFNILSPDALLRKYPGYVLDIGPPVGAGLRSLAQIKNGHIRYRKTSINMPALLQMQIVITGGAVERAQDQSLIAYVQSRAPAQAIDEFLTKMNLTTIELTTPDERLSGDPMKPTVFQYRKTVIFPKGEALLDMNTWETQILPEDMKVEMHSIVTGVLEGDTFSGVICNIATINVASIPDEIKVEFEGNVVLQLA